MRERLTLAFILVSIFLVLLTFLIRQEMLTSSLHDFERARLQHQCEVVSELVDERAADGRQLDESTLSDLVDSGVRLDYRPAAGPLVSVQGPGPRTSSLQDPTCSAPVTGGQITLTESQDVVTGIERESKSHGWAVLLLVILIAGALGFGIARSLSRPFRQLAGAAAALGRGRFDLDLPPTRIPEARSISQALQTSAERIQARLAQEQEFAQHASHVLRTPLTGLRLELDELAQREDLPEDARETSARCLSRVAEMDAVADELVRLSRGSRLVEDVQVSLQDLAVTAAQRWADRLAEQDRDLTAAVDGDVAVTYTPGPIEQILDLLLLDVTRHGAGDVRLVFEAGAEGLLRMRVSTAAPPIRPRGIEDGSWVARARAIAMALGGRIEGEDPVVGIQVLLPRR